MKIPSTSRAKDVLRSNALVFPDVALMLTSESHTTSRLSLANFARRGVSARWLLTILLAAMLGFSMSMATHEYDATAHTANEHCLTCDVLHAGGHGILAAAIQIFVPHGLSLAADTPHAVALNLSVHSYGARAPPYSTRYL